jgi:hypothetical protein
MGRVLQSPDFFLNSLVSSAEFARQRSAHSLGEGRHARRSLLTAQLAPWLIGGLIYLLVAGR